MENKYGAFSSSINPQALSLTVRGALVGVVPIVMYVTGMPQNEVDSLLEAIENFVYAGAALVSAGMILWGLVRKLLVAWKIMGRSE